MFLICIFIFMSSNCDNVVIYTCRPSVYISCFHWMTLSKNSPSHPTRHMKRWCRVQLKDWTSRIAYSIALIPTLYIFRKEVKTAQMTNLKSQTHIKTACIFSITTIISLNLHVCIHLLLIWLSDYTCFIRYHFMAPSIGLYHVTFRFIKLVYHNIAFTKQIHSKQYGYPQYLFYILYIIGISLVLYTCISVWFNYDISIVDNQCITSLEMHGTFCIYCSANVILWDILFSECMQPKLYKLDGKFNQRDTDIIKRINVILYKITFLVLLYEVIPIFCLVWKLCIYI